MATTNSPFQRRYPPEMRERAVRMVRDAIAESGERVGAVTRSGAPARRWPRVIAQLGQAARHRQATRPGITSAEQKRIAELERDVRELRRANEILKAALALFAAELDPLLLRKS